jgi:hypothetical protein
MKSGRKTIFLSIDPNSFISIPVRLCREIHVFLTLLQNWKENSNRSGKTGASSKIYPKEKPIVKKEFFTKTEKKSRKLTNKPQNTKTVTTKNTAFVEKILMKISGFI